MSKPLAIVTGAGLSIGQGAMIGVGVGLAVALGIARRLDANTSEFRADDKRAALVTYLLEHLAGADLAIQVVQTLRRTESTDYRSLFALLDEEFSRDREAVTDLLRSIGASSHSAKRVVSRASGSLLRLVAGGSRGQLSLFRTLEALSIGVQGKLCMWRALESVGTHVSAPGGRTLSDLQAAGHRQWDAIEAARRSLASQTFD